MKLLTLNTHSLIEENYDAKLKYFVEAIAKELPDIIALQEVNQSIDAETVEESRLAGYVKSDGDYTVKKDNHVFNVHKMLRKRNVDYYWTYIPIKNGYGRFEEGIALMSKSPITEVRSILVSNADDYKNWKTRKILGICTEQYENEHFFSVHYGWWNDKDEPFLSQWERTVNNIDNLGNIWLMGDFNNASCLRGEGYDAVKNSRFYDCYSLASFKDGGTTVRGAIDGWKDKKLPCDSMRLDQIWCRPTRRIRSCKVVFDGNNYPVVSDHYGVIVNL